MGQKIIFTALLALLLATCLELRSTSAQADTTATVAATAVASIPQPSGSLVDNIGAGTRGPSGDPTNNLSTTNAAAPSIPEPWNYVSVVATVVPVCLLYFGLRSCRKQALVRG